MKDIRGFTLAEVLVALTIGMILMSAIYLAVNMGQRTSSVLERKVTAHQDVKFALELMAIEIGMASYDSTATADIWMNPATCMVAASAADQANRGIQVATANTLTVEMDLNDNGIIDGTPNNANEIISYVYVPAQQYITRSTNCGGGQPFLGDTAASGRPRTVRVINSTLNIPVFRYYDGAGDPIAAGSLPGAIPTVRRIEITLAVETDQIDPDLGQRRKMIYSTAIIPRNHGINSP
jgi:prepilin-type N-terminal cleavage/methylation domain-containing protein